MRKQILLTALAALTTGLSIAQKGITKLDMNIGFGSSFPIHITPFAGGVACYANNGTRGWELFTTDGVSQPVMATDLNPLAGSAIGQFFNKPMAQIGSKLYFTADNGASGYELFVYNGSGSPLITSEIEIGTDGSSPDDFAVLNGILYFRARTSTEGYELWQYTPSLNQATRLTDIMPGTDSSVTGNITVYNNNIYFTADSNNNNELWVYNPLASTVAMVADINPGGSSSPHNLVVLNGKLYFTADDGTNGRELFAYDGISTPQRLTDVAPGSFDGIQDTKASLITWYNNKVYFVGMNTSAEKQIYVYDPATSNTVVAASTNGTNTSEPLWLTNYAGKIYFSSYNDTSGFELWAYDGVAAPAVAINFCKGTPSGSPQQLTPVGDNLYFRAVDCSGIGDELFKYNYKEVSIASLHFDGKATLYPNPASTAATLQLLLNKAEALLVNITDMQGRIVYTTGLQHFATGETMVALPAGKLQPGVYQCNIYSSEGRRYYNTKLVVK